MLRRTPSTKTVLCTHCGGANEVAAKAMSVFCAHCRKRLILENYKIRSYQAVKGYATCGDVVVEKSGRVAAPIQAGNIVVKGTVEGQINVRGRVQVNRNGRLIGNIVAGSLDVVEGATLVGLCRIGPAIAAEEGPPPAVAEAEPKAGSKPVASIRTYKPRNRMVGTAKGATGT